MLFRVAVLKAIGQSDLPEADRRLLLRYALFPRVHGVVDGKSCMVDMMEEAEAEMTKTAVAEGLAPAGAGIDWSKLLSWLRAEPAADHRADHGAGGSLRRPRLKDARCEDNRFSKLAPLQEPRDTRDRAGTG